MKTLYLEKYARLIIKTGINLQADQTLVITSPIECADFARLIAKTAYEEGARDVALNWRDEQLARIRFLHAPDVVFDEFPDWQRDFYLSYVRQGAAFLSISASDPELMQDVNPERMMRSHKAGNTALKEFRESIMGNKNTWCVVSVPTKSWAGKVFPNITQEAAVESLWDSIFKTVRLDTADPVAAWEVHKANLQQRLDFLNYHQFQYLHYHNSLGTDLTIELPENHLWQGGSDFTPQGIEFIANMPTEEVFTLPKKTGVNGTVFSSKPLNYNGNLIDEFSLTFKDGRVVDFQAAKGYESLQKLLATDEGASYLGEVALVPFDSPISNLNILFYNTLYDENASSHLAIGKAYPICIKDGANMNTEELAIRGVNDSLIHEDFMIGTSDLVITGYTASGEKIPVFQNGNFTF